MARAVLVLVLTGWGCQPVLPPAPEVEGVTPGWAYSGEETPIDIAGRNFVPDVLVDPVDGDAALDDGFRARLVPTGEGDAVDLVAPVLVSYELLRARVPAGAPAGLYAVEVTSPAGLVAEGPPTFVVSDTRAEQLLLTADDVAVSVDEVALVTVGVLDGDGQPLPEDLPVRLTVASDRADASPTFVEGDSSGLDGLALLDGGATLEGSLGGDGRAVVGVRSAVPDLVTVAVEERGGAGIVRGDQLLLEFSAGAVDRVEIDLPGGLETVAGEPFDVVLTVVDAEGQLAADAPVTVWLSETCGQAAEELTVWGRLTTTFTVTGATTADCPQNRLSAVGDAQGESPPFTTAPGEPAALELALVSDRAAAGTPLHALLWRVDAYGNVHLDWDDPVEATAVPVDPDEAGCEPPDANGFRPCSATFLSVFEDGAITWTDTGSGLVAVETGLAVEPGDPEAIEVVAWPDRAEAGVGFDGWVRVVDRWGNDAEVDPAGADPFVVSDAAGGLSCTWEGQEADGSHHLACLSYLAADPDEVAIEVPSWGVRGVIGGFRVVNGPLAAVDLVADPAEVVAGESFVLELAGFDEWGNPYLDQPDPVVDLWDEAGTLSPATAVLGPDGTATVLATVTAAGDPVSIGASQAGMELGWATLTVLPAEVDHLVVEEGSTWAWLGEPLDVTVRAEDRYGNALPDYAGPVTLTSLRGGFLATAVSAFSDGVAEAELAWDLAVLSDRIVATGPSLEEGRSGLVDALDPDCVAGQPPQAVLALGGDVETRVCLVAGIASALADVSGTVEGDAPLATFHLDDGVSGFRRRSAATTSEVLTWSEPGPKVVDLVVADENACGDRTQGVAWVGEDDGEPVGRVDVVVADAQVGTGSVGTSVALSARTCTGDPASGGHLLVRADLGEPLATPTGAGLEVTLDALGAATVDWSFLAEPSGGTATFHAGTAAGTAYGAGTVDVQGDDTPPVVVEATPAGTWSGTVDALEVRFSNPMNPGTVAAADIVLEGPAGTVDLASATLDASRTVLTLVPAQVVDADLGAWSLLLPATLREDISGNRLDGTWSGAPGGSAWVGVFGDVPDEAPVVTSCPPDTGRFVPDGDDGAGEEADEVGLDVVATAAPAWWEVEVHDAADVAVRWMRRAAGADAERVAWDGRGDDGRVVPAGPYTVWVTPVDAQGNLGTACSAGVEVVERYREPLP